MNLIQVRDSIIYFKSYGKVDSKTQFLYTHGGPGGNSLYGELKLSQEFLLKDSLIAFYDQRSCGRSPKTSILSHDDNVLDLMSLLEHRYTNRPWLIGHSYGTSLACVVAALRPDLLKGLILLSPIFSLYQSSNNLYLHSLTYLKYVANKKYKTYSKSDVVKNASSMFSKRDNAWGLFDSDEIKQLLYWYDYEQGLKYYSFYRNNKFSDYAYQKLRPTLFDNSSSIFPNTDLDFKKILNQIKNIPVLIIYGEEDVISDYLQITLIRSYLSNSILDIFPLSLCGHFPQFEHQKKVLAKIFSFCKENSNDSKSW